MDHLKTVEIIETMEGFMERERPPEEIREEVDMGYKIEGQSVIIFEIRPAWHKPDVILELPFAKATYVIAKDQWKTFWLRSNGNWDPYTPTPVVKSLNEFTALVEEDAHHCFFG